ncbi:MAG: aminotransferase class III-fold pyridoxal phosphate-dependent enzyme [Cyclobacteriaceae bacterium]|nr:aminotransferase class III-fold pyridoxal phosphate-dependent enzyme [Cyclobacteriaceae bacterium]
MQTAAPVSTAFNDNLKHTLFAWSKQAGLNPLNIVKTKGVYLYEASGKKIIDFSSQLMNVNIGHGDTRVNEAIIRQMDEVSYVVPAASTEVRGRLGKRVAEIAPEGMNKTFFTLGGADAIENGIKIARVVTGRYKIISLYRSYHGSTHGAFSAGGDPRKHAVDSNQVPNFIHVENPYFYRCPWHSSTPEECAERAAAHMEQVIQYENPESVAAILMEGESGSSGCIKYPPGYWKKVKAIADKYGILTISDEVMSGFGRTGKWFGVDNHDVAPDIICMAKGLTSGYLPLGGVIVSDKIAKHFDEKAMPLGLTYSAHPLSCAAALAVIDIYDSDGLFANTMKMGKYIEEQIEKMKDKHPSIGDFRNTGLLGCIELVKNRKTKEPVTPWNAKPDKMEVTNKIAAKLKELGMFTFVRWNYIFVAPPLIINKDEVDEGLDILSKAISIADEYCN